MSRKKWKVRNEPVDVVEPLAHQLDLPHAIAQILVRQGFHDPDAAGKFMDPRLADLNDPFVLPDMDQAVDRIWMAIHNAESIVVFGDYDVDGITAAALLLRILTELGGRVNGFVPDRLDEGYGLSPDAVERCLAELQPDLLITVDCGTNSVDSVAQARSRGVDVIVTDHHVPASETAPALAVVNPKLGCEGEHLSGAGVVFKLAHALIKSGRSDGRQHANEIDLRHYLDIAALGTVADIVPLVGDNRIIVRHGLLQLQSSRWVGMEALKKVAAIKGELNTGHLGFQLGPRINAAGRIGEPLQALKLMTTNDPGEAHAISVLLDRKNQERRRLEEQISEEAFADIDSRFDADAHFGLVTAGEGWHPGVVGIVASRIANRYNRPAIVLGVDTDGSAHGSCRSIEAFDMLAGLQACRQHLTQFGGHRIAAGLAVKAGALDAFKEAFNAAVADALRGVDLSPIQHIDAVVQPDELGWPFYESLQRLRPFGQGNAEPVWMLEGVQLAATPRVVGRKHLKLTFSADKQTFNAIAFNYPLSSLPEGRIDVAFTLKENVWNGTSSLQLQVQDIRSACSIGSGVF